MKRLCRDRGEIRVDHVDLFYHPTIKPRLSGPGLSGFFDYSDSRLSGLLSQAPASPDNRGLTVSTKQLLLLLKTFIFSRIAMP